MNTFPVTIGSAAAASHTRWRLVSVDDDPLNAELIARNARKCGYEARPVVDPQVLAELVPEWCPHVVTLDLRMPNATGSDVVSVLRAVGFSGHIVIISGLGLPVLDAVRKQAQEAGLRVAGQMQKPINLQVLRKLFSDIAGKPA